MKIDRAEAKRIADLAHLAFDDVGLDRMAGELSKILTYIDQLRDDEPRPSVDRDDVARNAPAWSDGYFVVPKVIGD